MTTKKARSTKRKHLVRGHDWHAWAWRDKSIGRDGFCFWAEPEKPNRRPTDEGEWIRVKFVPVK